MNLQLRSRAPSSSWGFTPRRGYMYAPGLRRNMRGAIGSFAGSQLQNLPTQGLKIVPSDVFLWAAGGSVLLSLSLRLFGRRDDALFVGEWAPTMVSLGVLARLVGR